MMGSHYVLMSGGREDSGFLIIIIILAIIIIIITIIVVLTIVTITVLVITMHIINVLSIIMSIAFLYFCSHYNATNVAVVMLRTLVL